MNAIETLNWRYATKRMTDKKVSQKDIDTILEAINLSPSAYGLQPYKVIIIENRELLNTIFETACPQPVVQQCSHLIIFKTLKKITSDYIDEYLENMQKTRNLSDDYISMYREKIGATFQNSAFNQFNWAKNQTYLTSGIAIMTAAQLKVDATPIEGFNPQKLNEVLGLDTEKETTTLLLTLGYRDEKEDHLAGMPKVRKRIDDLVEIL